MNNRKCVVLGDRQCGKTDFIASLKGFTSAEIFEQVHPSGGRQKIEVEDILYGSKQIVHLDEYNICSYNNNRQMCDQADVVFCLSQIDFQEYGEIFNDNAIVDKCIFVRTKVDSNVTGEERKTHRNRGRIVQNIREGILQTHRFISRENLFLIVNLEPTMYDFNELVERITELSPFALFNFCHLTKSQLIYNKLKNKFRQRAEFVAERAAVNPSPNSLLTCNINIVKEEVRFYYTLLRLNCDEISEIKIKLEIIRTAGHVVCQVAGDPNPPDRPSMDDTRISRKAITQYLNNECEKALETIRPD